MLNADGSLPADGFAGYEHTYQSEDLPLLQRILERGQYHAVVGNPPYIVVRDRSLNKAYRERYKTCHRQYSLAVPFAERFFDLCLSGGNGRSGYCGMITANSFMKREFGKKLVEDFFGTVDLTHVVDTSGAYIPGHGTPTVILLGRNRRPVGETVRAVLGIKGEPRTPDDPAQGLVWQSIVERIDAAGTEDAYTSAADVARETFGKHPWSIGGGGAGNLVQLIDESATAILRDIAAAIGRVAHTGSDEAYIASKSSLTRRGIPDTNVAIFVEGDRCRDWEIRNPTSVLFPYAVNLLPLDEDACSAVFRWLWPFRDQLWNRREPNGSHREIGKTWFEFSRFHPERFVGPGIAFAFVASHNHFVLDRGGKVFKQSAPIIKLPEGSSEEEHLGLLGLLNSSTACFWMKQTLHDKGGGGIGGGLATEAWEHFYEYTGTGLQRFPVTESKPLEIARALDGLAREYQSHLPETVCGSCTPTAAQLAELREKAESIRARMIALQEELDWECYESYGLLAKAEGGRLKAEGKEEAPPLALGERAFEIVMARQMAEGELETTWFERHGSTPITEIPSHWPEAYRRVVERRIEIIETNKEIALIEKPEYKRRWNTEPWESQQERALKSWLLERMERYFDFDGRMTKRSAVSGQQSAGREDKAVSSQRSANSRAEEEAVSGQRSANSRAEEEAVSGQRSANSRAEEEAVSGQRSANSRAEEEAVSGQRSANSRAEEEAVSSQRSANSKTEGRKTEEAVSGQRSAGQEDRADSSLPADRSLPANGSFIAECSVISVARLADIARQDADFLAVGEIYADDAAFDVEKLVAELVEGESVPFLPVLRYKPSGLRKREVWERTWELQRKEEAASGQREVSRAEEEAVSGQRSANSRAEEEAVSGQQSAISRAEEEAVSGQQSAISRAEEEAVSGQRSAISRAEEEAVSGQRSAISKTEGRKTEGRKTEEAVRGLDRSSIPVPPKYTSGDFLKASYWRLRGKLDVPKERWISFPHSPGADGTLAVAWAGYDHLQLAKAISAYYVDVAEKDSGMEPARLVPLLACLAELIPWLKQWHNAVDREFRLPMGDYFEGFLEEEARNFDMTVDQIKAWVPEKKTKTSSRKAAKREREED